jgi:hypothetical protein
MVVPIEVSHHLRVFIQELQPGFRGRVLPAAFGGVQAHVVAVQHDEASVLHAEIVVPALHPYFSRYLGNQLFRDRIIMIDLPMVQQGFLIMLQKQKGIKNLVW